MNSNKKDIKVARDYSAGKAHNDKPNYKKGARRKIMAVVLYAGSVCLKSCYLLSEPDPAPGSKTPTGVSGTHRSLRNKINDMVNEGLLSKEHSNGCYYLAISKRNEEYKDIAREYFSPELLDLYNSFGSLQLRKLRTTYTPSVKVTKNMKPEEKKEASSLKHRAKTEALRAQRVSETIMFMDGVGIDYLPGGFDYELELPTDKKPNLSSNEPIINAYYTYHEIATLDPDNYIFQNQSSRSTGFMFTVGGNYIVYNFSDKFIEIQSGPETRIINSMKSKFLPLRKMEDIKGQIVLYRNPKVFSDFLTLDNSFHISSFNNLTSNCMHTYLLPLDKTGQKLARLMTVRSWEERLKYLIVNAFKNELKDTDNFAFANDGIMNVHLKTGIVKRYVFFFVIPDIVRFTGFKNAVLAANDRSHYEVFCYDFQEKEIRECLENKAVVTALPFNDIYNAFVNAYLKDSRE